MEFLIAGRKLPTFVLKKKKLDSGVRLLFPKNQGLKGLN